MVWQEAATKLLKTTLKMRAFSSGVDTRKQELLHGKDVQVLDVRCFSSVITSQGGSMIFLGQEVAFIVLKPQNSP